MNRYVIVLEDGKLVIRIPQANEDTFQEWLSKCKDPLVVVDRDIKVVKQVRGMPNTKINERKQ